MNRILFTPLLLGTAVSHLAAQEPSSPNIVLIMCDDMGFSDLGCYGSEIETPHWTALLRRGCVSLSLRIQDGVVLPVPPC